MQSAETIDYFILLGQPRRPWLDPEVLKQRFLQLSAETHPDRIHNQPETERATAHKYHTDLNAAYRCLREPKDRLRHLLELERGKVSSDLQRIPSDLMDVSMEIGSACREADQLITRKASASSSLLKAQQFQRQQEWVDRLQDLKKKLDGFAGRLIEESKRVDTEWPPGNGNTPPSTELLNKLDGLCRIWGFVNRWQNQLQDRIVQLSF